MENYQSYLAKAIAFKETGHGEPSFLFNDKGEAVRVANYLRSYGYDIKTREYKLGLPGKWILVTIK